jgi:hypothetical protein
MESKDAFELNFLKQYAEKVKCHLEKVNISMFLRCRSTAVIFEGSGDKFPQPLLFSFAKRR